MDQYPPKINTFKVAIIVILIFIFLCGCTSEQQSSLYATDTHVSLGMVYLQQGNFENARSVLIQALNEHPRSPLNWAAMAYLDEDTGNPISAEREYLQAISLAPDQGEWHNNYGVFLCRNNQFYKGIKEILTAAQSSFYVYKASAYKNAGLCALKIPDKASANKYFAAAALNGA